MNVYQIKIERDEHYVSGGCVRWSDIIYINQKTFDEISEKINQPIYLINDVFPWKIVNYQLICYNHDKTQYVFVK